MDLSQVWLQNSSWPPLTYPVWLTFSWPLIDYFRFNFLPFTLLNLHLESQRAPTRIFHSANNGDGVLTSRACIFALIESLCRASISWENPTVVFSAKCEPRTRCRYLKATVRSKHVSVIVRSISLSRFPCHDFAIRPIGISFGVWLPLPCQEKIHFTIWLEVRDLYASTLLPKHIISIQFDTWRIV